MKKLMTITLVAAFLGACASSKPPTEKLTQSETSIEQAEQIGADQYAPLELREAKKKLEKARELSDDEEYGKAWRLAERARIDAEYAEIKTLSTKAQRAVDELKESIKTLKEEIENKTNDRYERLDK